MPSLQSVGDHHDPFPVQHGRGNGATYPAARDLRDEPLSDPGERPARDIDVPNLWSIAGIKVPPRNSR